jgi:hypothetical protein
MLDQHIETTPGISGDMPIDPSDAMWLVEIERRGRAALAGEPGFSWEDVRADIRRRLAGG